MIPPFAPFSVRTAGIVSADSYDSRFCELREAVREIVFATGNKKPTTREQMLERRRERQIITRGLHPLVVLSLADADEHDYWYPSYLEGATQMGVGVTPGYGFSLEDPERFVARPRLDNPVFKRMGNLAYRHMLLFARKQQFHPPVATSAS